MKCDICGELHSLDEGKIIKGSGHTYFVCDDCDPDNYAICDDCGELVHQDNVYWEEGSDETYCEYCYSTEIQNRVVNSYHSNNDWIVHYTENEYNDYMSDKLCVQCEIPYEVAQHIVGKEV